MTITDPLIGSQLGDYTIVDILGRGGMSRVYRGYDARLDRYAAVKVIDAHLVTTENEDEYRQRFQREARAIARLHHPHIVGVYQFGDFNGLYYMAQAFIEGRDLGQVLKQYAAEGRRMTYGEILRIVADIAAALDHAHHQGVIHRDIKPSNIMITANGHATLMDFGLALSVPEGSMGNTFGSVHYIAPEQAISSADAVPESDLYSLGVVLYQMLAGKVPFDDPSAMSVVLKHISNPPPPLRQFNPEIKPEIEAVVMKLLQKDVADRYHSGAELVMALKTAFDLSQAGKPLAAPTPPVTPKLQTETAHAIATQTLATESSTKSQKSALARPPAAATPVPPPSPAAPSNPSRPTGAPTASVPVPPAPRKASPLPYAIAGIVLLIVIGAGAALLISNSAAPVTPTPAAVALATAESTDAPTPAERTPQVAAARVTATDVEAAAEVTITSAANTAETSDPTERPVATSTRRPSATPRPTEPRQQPSATTRPATEIAAGAITAAAQGDSPILLLYDDDRLTLVNRSDDTLSIAGLTFVRPTASGGAVTLRADSWANRIGEERGIIGPGDCYEVWRNEFYELEAMESCGNRLAWQSVGQQRQFWISDEADTQFEVRRGDQVLAACTIGDGECSFDPRGSDTD